MPLRTDNLDISLLATYLMEVHEVEKSIRESGYGGSIPLHEQERLNDARFQAAAKLSELIDSRVEEILRERKLIQFFD